MMDTYMITLQGNKSGDTYATKRKSGYFEMYEQLDILYHDITNDKLGEEAKTSNFYLHRKSIKNKYPKP